LSGIYSVPKDLTADPRTGVNTGVIGYASMAGPKVGAMTQLGVPRDRTLDVRSGSLQATSMRYHELWLQRWLYSRFFVRQGYSVPVVFATPMDAFSMFTRLWSDAQNPFKFLLDAVDENGTPLYEPYPSPVRYPLISVMRKGVKLRPYQNFSIHRWRHINWPTISDETPVPGKEQIGNSLVKCDLGNVTTSRMPMAFDYKFQIDHFCLRPDTQAFYLETLLNQFWRSGGGMQNWFQIEYPGWGLQYIRCYLEGEIDTTMPEEYENKNVEFRTSYTLIVEGFSIDVRFTIQPALWTLIISSGTPDQLNNLLQIEYRQDLRTIGHNYTLEHRPIVPSAGTCQQEGLVNQWLASGTESIVMNGVAGTVPLSYGIASTAVLGFGTLVAA